MNNINEDKFKINYKNLANGFDLLKTIPDEEIKVVFFDPQYRGILDKMSYGNEGENRGKDRSSLPQMDNDTIKKFLNETDRILAPNGYLFLWVDKFSVASGEVAEWLKETPKIKIVDLLVWNKMKLGMGYRTRNINEWLVIIQKKPQQAKSTWIDHSIPNNWAEKIETKNHTHSKPVELQKRLIEATTEKNDVIVDFCAGGYSVLEACKRSGRRFYGCDIVFGEKQKTKDKEDKTL